MKKRELLRYYNQKLLNKEESASEEVISILLKEFEELSVVYGTYHAYCKVSPKYLYLLWKIKNSRELFEEDFAYYLPLEIKKSILLIKLDIEFDGDTNFAMLSNSPMPSYASYEIQRNGIMNMTK